MSIVYRFLLALTALAPISVAYAANYFSTNEIGKGLAILLVALLLVVICCLLLRFAKTEGEDQVLHVEAVKPSDGEMLAFLIAYLLPLLSQDTFDIYDKPLVSIVTLSIIFLCVFFSNAFQFNPLLCLFGYHFYEIETREGIPALLISRAEITTGTFTTFVKGIGNHVYIDVGRPVR